MVQVKYTENKRIFKSLPATYSKLLSELNVRDDTFLGVFHCFTISILDSSHTVKFLFEVHTAKNDAHDDSVRQVPTFRCE